PAGAGDPRARAGPGPLPDRAVGPRVRGRGTGWCADLAGRGIPGPTIRRVMTNLGIGLIGYAFMGAAHSQAWRSAPRFFDLPLEPEMNVLGGRNAEAVQAAAKKLGWKDTETDWRKLIARDDVQLVDVCTPGDSHAEIAIAALEAGKHVLCEKPLANTVE